MRRGHIEFERRDDLASIRHIVEIDPLVGVCLLIVVGRRQKRCRDDICRSHDVPATRHIREPDDCILIKDDSWFLPCSYVECDTSITRRRQPSVTAGQHASQHIGRSLIQPIAAPQSPRRLRTARLQRHRSGRAIERPLPSLYGQRRGEQRYRQPHAIGMSHVIVDHGSGIVRPRHGPGNRIDHLRSARNHAVERVGEV